MLPSTWDETPRDYIENRENEIVNNHAQYCSVVKTGIGSTVMILGGEVDAGTDYFQASPAISDFQQCGITSPKTVAQQTGLS